MQVLLSLMLVETLALLAPIVCVRPECADILRNAAKTMPEVSPSAARAISLAFESDEAARIIASLSFQSSRAKQVALAPVLEPLPDAACAEVVADLDAETKIPLLRTLLRALRSADLMQPMSLRSQYMCSLPKHFCISVIHRLHSIR